MWRYGLFTLPRRLNTEQLFKLYEEFLKSPKSLVVTNETLIDRTPEGAIKDYIIYLRRRNGGII